MEKENFGIFDQPQSAAQVPLDNNYTNNVFSFETQELGHIDEVFNWLDEENNKAKNKYSAFEHVPDIFGMDHMQDFGFLTPTIPEINFF